MNHTPGPWGYFKNCAGEYSIFPTSCGHFDSEGKGYAANVFASVEDEANARLIAAAPDLVELCNDLLIHGADAEPIRQKAWKVLRRIYGKEEE